MAEEPLKDEEWNALFERLIADTLERNLEWIQAPAGTRTNIEFQTVTHPDPVKAMRIRVGIRGDSASIVYIRVVRDPEMYVDEEWFALYDSSGYGDRAHMARILFSLIQLIHGARDGIVLSIRTYTPTMTTLLREHTEMIRMGIRNYVGTR